MTWYINAMAKSTNRTCAKFAVIPDSHAINYPQGMHKVNDSGATMSAEAVFEVKTYSASMASYSTGNRAVAPPDRRGAKIIREYKTKLKTLTRNLQQKLLEMDQTTQLALLKCHLADFTKGELFHSLLVGLGKSTKI